MHDTSYTSNTKAEWRKWIYTILDPKYTHLVNDSGELQYKWLEPVGDDALTFTQLLATDKVTEDNLIGIDYDPKFPERSMMNIASCKMLFPNATFHDKEWNDFCCEYNQNDIGVFVFDFYTSTFGKNIEYMLESALPLIGACKQFLGEVLLIVNADIGYAKRHHRGTPEAYANELEQIFSTSSNHAINTIKVNPDTCYTYKQAKGKTTMGSFAIFI
jgi:hypothetical protein